jgi:hypothetical protein
LIPHQTVEPLAEFFVSTPTAGDYFACGAGHASYIRLQPGCGALLWIRQRAAEPVGVSNLTFVSDKDDERRRRSAPSPQGHDADVPPTKKKRGTTPEVGNALRAAYQQTIDETIPPEFLDLLGKLG